MAVDVVVVVFVFITIQVRAVRWIWYSSMNNVPTRLRRTHDNCAKTAVKNWIKVKKRKKKDTHLRDGINPDSGPDGAGGWGKAKGQHSTHAKMKSAQLNLTWYLCAWNLPGRRRRRRRHRWRWRTTSKTRYIASKKCHAAAPASYVKWLMSSRWMGWGQEIQENARVTMTTISTGVVVSQSQPQPKPLPLVRWLGKRHTTMKWSWGLSWGNVSCISRVGACRTRGLELVLPASNGYQITIKCFLFCAASDYQHRKWLTTESWGFPLNCVWLGTCVLRFKVFRKKRLSIQNIEQVLIKFFFIPFHFKWVILKMDLFML